MDNRLRIKLATLSAALASGLLVCLATLRADDPNRPGAEKEADPFDDADLAFRDIYGRARAATLARLRPVIVVNMDDLILIRDGRREEAKVIPPIYHRLKAVSHIPLAIYVALAPYGEAPLDDDRLARLRSFRDRVEKVRASLDRSDLGPENAARSRGLMDRCAAFLDGVLKDGRYKASDLKALTRGAAPDVLANADAAARSQIDAYHARVSAWRRGMPEGEWSKVRVLVVGHAMPRKRNLAVQYFAKLLGVEGESRRVVYAEELSGEKQGLDLLATHQLDGELSDAFFGDPERMEIDLLANAAAAYLDGFNFDK